MIIDAHIHLWGRLHGDDLGIDREALGWGRAREGERVYYATPPSFEDSLSTFERALAHMDWLGIDRAVVYQGPMDGKQDDYFAQVRQACPDRFVCLAFLDPRAAEDPLRTLAEAIDDKKLQGFVVNTPNPVPAAATAELMPLWEACAERGLPVVLQNGVPADIAKLAKALPELKIVLSHFSGAAGPADEHHQRLEIVASCPNVYTDTGGLTHRYRYPFPEPKDVLRSALAMVGAHKIAWGSDYPRPTLVADNSYKQQLEFITVECDFLSDAQREQMLFRTALGIYPWSTQ
jgi:predicted TIM-barrel fold metal-dependent hydrolase